MNNFVIIDGSTEVEFNDIGNLEGFEYPDMITVIEDIAGPGGAHYITSKFGRRRLSWEGFIRENGPANRRDLLALRPGNLKTLKFETCDGLELQTQIEVEKIVMPYRLGQSKYLFEVTSPDWRFVSQDVTTFTTGETTVIGGVDIPADIPFEFSSSSSPTNTFVNDGNDYADPTFIIHGPGTSFLVRNQTTEQEFTIEYSIDDTEEIWVDTYNRTVLLNNETSIYSSLSGDFWSLAPGDNIIGFTVSGGDVETLLTIEARASYTGI